MPQQIIRVLLLLTVFISTTFANKVLTSISLDGLDKGDQRAIMALIPLTVGEEYSKEDIAKTIKQLYKTGKFRDIAVSTVNERESSTGLRITVELNPYCDGVEFAGNKKITKSKLEEIVKIKRGELLSDAKIYDNIIAIKRAYEDKGYLKASIECELVPTSVEGYDIAKFHIRERDKVRVEKITFYGNKAYTQKQLKRKLKTKERHVFSSGEYDEEVFPKHLDTLIQFYKKNGYLDAFIADDSVYYNDDSTGLNIDITINEGEQYFVGDFFFNNNKVIDDYTLLRQITLRPGKPFDDEEFKKSVGMVSNAYRNEGYLWSQVTPKFVYRGDTIDVIFDVVEGNPAIVRKINIQGNEKTRDQVIRRELTIYPGQKYNQALMERSVRNIRQLNYFENNQVLPDITPNQDGTIDLIFNVKEKENIGQFSAGITYSQQEGLGGNFSISIPNFRGAGEKLDAMAEIARGRQRYSLGFVEPWIFNTPTSFSSRVFYENVHNIHDAKYDYKRVGTEFGFGKKLKWPDDYFSGAIRYLVSYDKNSYTNPSEEERLGIDIVSQGLLSRLYLALTRNDTDYPQFATRGSVFRPALYIGGLGGQYNYLKGTIQYNWYQRLFGKFVLGAKTKLGMIGAIDGKVRVGYSDLFQVGGVYYDGVVRGYGEGELGTNLMMMTLSAEVRYPIIDQQFYIGAFFDMGNSWNKLSEINVAELDKGVGLGFRLMLPMVGLLGFDFGWPLDFPNQNPLDLNYDYKAKPKFYFIMNKGF